MNNEKIAILVDTCCDVPKELIDTYGMYVIPLKINYKNAEYSDGVDITAQQVYQGLKTEVPKTSLPSGEQILAIFQQIQKDGYEKVITVTISSGLSGTNNVIRLIAEDYVGMEIFVLDTKNISIGSGFHAIQAARYIAQGDTFEMVKQKLTAGIMHCKIFFVVETLEYLQKGGRIGLVASLFGNALNLKPIISCNADGIYYTVAKVRGRKQSLRKTKELALAYAKQYAHYHIAVMHGDAADIADEMKNDILSELNACDVFVEGQVSPALGVHTGPGAIGIAVYAIE